MPTTSPVVDARRGKDGCDRRALLRAWGPTLLAGLALGIGATLTDVWPNRPRTVALVGQLGGPWLVTAMLVGARWPRRRAAAWHGLAALLAGLAVYDGVQLVQGAVPLRMVLWLVVALVAGPIGGMLGQAWRHDSRPVRGAVLGAAVWGLAAGEAARGADPRNNQLAWVAAAVLVGAVLSAAPGRRGLTLLTATAVGAVTIAALPTLLGIAAAVLG